MRTDLFTTAVLIAATSVALAACSQFEPFRRQGTWHENNAPMHNIAVELANPQDLYHGSGHPVLTGNIAETAIDGMTTTIQPTSGSTGGSQSGTATTAGTSTGGAAGSSGSTASAGAVGGGMGSGSTNGTSGGAMP